MAYPGFDLVVVTNMDEYTRGIAEMPYSWHAEALKTQAVAARSYGAATASANDHKNRGCFCDIGNSSSDQVYAGWTRSWPDGTKWEAAANATAGKIIRHASAPDGMIVRAYYSSSNGGATEASVDKWGGYRSYLISKADGQSITSINPLATWTKTFTADQVIDKVWSSSSTYNAYRLTSADVIERHASGSVKTVKFTADGAELGTISKTVDWDLIDQNFGLNSWYFDINDSQVAGAPPSTVPNGASSVAMHDPKTGIWSLRMPNGSVKTFYYGDPKDEPFIGDWNGDGIETVGLYRRSVGFLFIRNSNTQGVADIDIYYGIPGDIPIAGDWNGDGTDTVGIYRPSNATFYLRNSNTQGIADITRPFGNTGDQPIAGDWNGDGKDTIGVYRPSTEMVYLTDNLATGSISVAFNYRGAAAGDKVISGDWNKDGKDTLGVFRPSNGKFYLRDTFTQSSANIIFDFGDSWMNPVAGKWN
jgi:SpoIID/LytB domain protein